MSFSRAEVSFPTSANKGKPGSRPLRGRGRGLRPAWQWPSHAEQKAERNPEAHEEQPTLILSTTYCRARIGSSIFRHGTPRPPQRGRPARQFMFSYCICCAEQILARPGEKEMLQKLTHAT